MAAAARVIDLTSHPGIVSGPGVPTVLIGGMPAAVASDTHTCALSPTPHAPSIFPNGSMTVLIGGRQALRMGDRAGCGAIIVTGALNVLIGG